MKNFRTFLKWGFIVLAGLALIFFLFVFWVKSLVPPKNLELETTKAIELPYLNENIPLHRGKILAIVTSTNKMGPEATATGYELTELARAYYVFQANGFEVDVASPLGGNPPVVIDDEDMGVYDYAFLNDTIAQQKLKNTIRIANINENNYKAVYFVGGKGAMFDFPDNKKIQTIVKNFYETNKVIGAVCHGPAALVNVTLSNGQQLVENKKISSFTNNEELLLIPEAKTIFPFLLQDKLIAKGADFKEGTMYLENVSHDKNLVTGQNPWSVWKLAETMVIQLGYTPKYRALTDEENAVKVLSAYNTYGKEKARVLIHQIIKEKQQPLSRLLIAKHSIMSGIKGDIGGFVNLLSLTAYAKKMNEYYKNH